MIRGTNNGIRFLGTIIVSGVISLASAIPVMAAGPTWKIESISPTAVEPGSSFRYIVEARNVGVEETDPADPFTLEATLPPGISAASATGIHGTSFAYDCAIANAVDPVSEPSKVICQPEQPLEPRGNETLRLTASVDAATTPGGLAASFQIAGGGAASASASDPIRIGEVAGFGVDAFDGLVSVDQGGASSTKAGAHPYEISTHIDFNTADNPHPLFSGPFPVEPTRDVFVELPPGLLGSTSGFGRCTLAELSNSVGTNPRPLCAPESQVGTTVVRSINPGGSSFLGPMPVFNVDPPPGVPARFGFNVAGVTVVLDAEVRSDGDFGLTVASRGISEGLGVDGTTVTFWGIPAEASHATEHACPEKGPPSNTGISCPSKAEPIPLLRNPTGCTAPGTGLVSSLHIDSWVRPGALTSSGGPDLSDPTWKSASFTSHRAPGWPNPPSDWGEVVGIDGCAKVPFTPGFSAQPTTDVADSPSGLLVDLTIPQDCWNAGQANAICESDLKEAEVKLPAGMTLNPSAATGLGACSPAQIGLTSPTGVTPAHFTRARAACPDNSKIGDVAIKTPLLEEELKGAVYLAKQSDNPFDSLLAMYLVAEGAGVVVKQAGKIEAGPGGRLTTTFSEAPQTPFSSLRLSLYGGPRAALRTPPACGEYTTQTKLTPWTGNAAATPSSVFSISNCPNSGFDPRFSAGTTNPLAGAFSPFALRLTREDGTQELGALRAALPQGLIGSLRGIPYCPDAALNAVSATLGTGAAQIASPSCSAASQVGTVTVGAGAGPNPFYTQAGRAYLAGPYKGAPLSLAVVTPAVAGPFDLGTVVVRNALQIDPESAQITAVSDPFPTILHGVPLDLRDVRVDLRRPNFTLNPTDCDREAITATISSAQGAAADRSQPFQVGACDRLAFKPKLSLRLKGGSKRSDYPALRATLTMPAGGANIERAQVALPHTAFLAQSHIRTICTRVQFAADQCPKGSIYGYAKAITPLLDQPLEGPVYLRSSDNPLPDLVAALHGQIDVDLVGRIDSKNGGIRTTFASVPDAPVSKFTLSMQGGKKGLLENSRDLCTSTNRATALFDGQNGKVRDLEPVLRADCGKKHTRRRP